MFVVADFSLLGSHLGCRFSNPFITLNVSCHSLLTCRVSAENSTDNFIGIPLCVICVCSVVSDSFETPRTVASQAPLSMWFSRQEYWGGLPFPSPWESSWSREQSCVLCLLVIKNWHWQANSLPLALPCYLLFYVIRYFLLFPCFIIFSLYLIFVSFINICLEDQFTLIILRSKRLRKNLWPFF